MEQRLRMAQKSQEGSHKRSRRYPALSWRYHCGSDARPRQAAASSAERQPDPRKAPYETTARRGGLALCAPQSYFAEHQKAEGSAAALTLRILPLVVSSEARRERGPGAAWGGLQHRQSAGVSSSKLCHRRWCSPRTSTSTRCKFGSDCPGGCDFKSPPSNSAAFSSCANFHPVLAAVQYPVQGLFFSPFCF